ncbi:double zinc ribbon domain-containing protein [Halorubrum halodurans]|uniref:CopG family transcriptional regulator n=1 Tax=Halorubrum halodurans TaxID=1383851 RepID=A0A256IC11_9EURY|nr:zinc ribbon domain-containing protein [Halorubrum halodurans]OYR54079.1 CopG family transcriptional regulator [Halorubrum halodurans]
MSKITFRAGDDLVERLEACEASKSEVMREALRAHLDGPTEGSDGGVDTALSDRIDDLIADRIDAALDDRLGSADRRHREDAYTPSTPGEINVNVTLDAPGGDDDDVRVTGETEPETEGDARKTRADRAVQTVENVCGGCGENVPERHVYCPNCGEKQSHRAFCECGDEVRTDWAFCPGCGRRTPAADVLNDR